jgi:hypothetical protein
MSDCACPFPRTLCPACSHPCISCAIARGDAVELPAITTPAPPAFERPQYPRTVWEVLAWIQVYKTRIFIRVDTAPHTRPLSDLSDVEAARWVAEALVRWYTTDRRILSLRPDRAMQVPPVPRLSHPQKAGRCQSPG